jgi:hypothetical protein
MREQGIDFEQCSNAFLRCSAPERLQALADSLSTEDLSNCGRKWLAYFTPFFSDRERRQAGCQHRLFFSQVEFCDNLIFYRGPPSTSWASVCSTPTGRSASRIR